MRSKWVVGNWKMNGNLSDNAVLLNDLVAGMSETCPACACQSEGGCETECPVYMGVCVPFPYLAQAHRVLGATKIALGAQNVSDKANGAFTGEVSTAMLKDFGVKLVIVGHSERRSLYGETDGLVAEKARVALEAGLTPVVCVGETLDEREAGQAQAVVLRQLKAVSDVIGVSGLSRSILAYEPVWAIGTGKTASPEQAQEVHAWLRAALQELDGTMAENISILYGGSVKASNAAEIFAQADVDGGLIGGAALVAEDFLTIYQSA
ncbi:MAG: triose-phosphate isomerase [Burkholderiales bacterium]|jgi:triosephosphate isomerase|nr:triose-phosphate isomerase [Burkholderiales bacterium]MCE1176241.1 triose-phosphate isomerase [Burkholderiales bacterium]